MAIQSFFRQRSPRRFSHKPIYWDPRAEELDKRIDRIRQELVESGEIEAEEITSSAEERESKSAREDFRGAFSGQTDHLRRQQEQGISSQDRSRRMIRLMLTLLILGFVLWFFFMR